MSNTMDYKGYTGSVEFSTEDRLFFGKVLGIKALISYEGSSADDLVEDFQGAVDDYLALCASQGVAPEKPYKGSKSPTRAPSTSASPRSCTVKLLYLPTRITFP